MQHSFYSGKEANQIQHRCCGTWVKFGNGKISGTKVLLIPNIHAQLSVDLIQKSNIFSGGSVNILSISQVKRQISLTGCSRQDFRAEKSH